jgi:hypothetical protein
MRFLALAALACAAACSEPILALPSPHAALPSSEGASAGDPATPPARVFVIERSADLLTGPEAAGRIGDLRLDNGKVSFVIQAAGSSTGFADSGGELVDAAPADGEDALEQVIGCLADSFPRQPIYTRVEPATQGRTALVRAIGSDARNPEIAIETDYALAPGSIALEITTRVHNHSARALTGYAVGDAIEWGRAERFVPGHATVPDRLDAVEGWLGALGEQVSYAYVVPGTLVEQHGPTWSDLDAGVLDLPPGGTQTVKRWLVVGDASGTEVTRTVGLLRGQRWARLEGHVREDATGAALAGAEVVLEDRTGAPLAEVRSTARGYVAFAPPGEYRVRASGLGRRGNDLDVDLRASGATVDVLMSQPGALEYQVKEGKTLGPARLTFLSGDGRPVRLGPPFADPGGNVALTVSGRGRLPLAPGVYRVIASRGPQLDLDVQDLEVPAGGVAKAQFSLARAFDRKGWVCAELHQHASPSADSAVSLRDRLASALAEGLDAVVTSDHDVIADWKPALDALGATRPLVVIPGEEATAFGIGHFSAWPLELAPGQPRGGAPDPHGPSGKSAHAMVLALRALPSSPSAPGRVVVLDHPRAGSLGYFNNVGLDLRASAPPAGFESGYDAIEVFRGDRTASVEAPLHDWFWLLDRGLTFTAVGGSDAHRIAGDEVGYPRTCVPLLGAGVEASLVDAIARRRSALITNGPFVRVSVAGRGMGELAPAPKGRARLDVEVQAAPWIDARRLEVFVSGERRGKPIEIAQPQKGQPLDWKRSIDLEVRSDAYVVVLVRGDTPLEPVIAHRQGGSQPTPLAITNPIYLDQNLDGKYTPPYSAARKR